MRFLSGQNMPDLSLFKPYNSDFRENHNLKDKKKQHIIKFDNLLYESLYVTDMAMCKDEILISTLNHGAYLLGIENDGVKIEKWKFRESGEIREIERIDVNERQSD